MALDILYFAWVREAVGRGAETRDPPADVTTVAALIDWLRRQSAAHEAALADVTRLRAAVDQQFVPLDASIIGAREVALFPPVTGG
ncbi:molybdopterin converting factor subunit 1 [Sphingomonas sp.]|uniref:molybdopterin converting factor subunit 1 n=1 Tax=Sphingomonas sp. TaxID=28214 RepID=UPI001D26FBDB|nr:molybdopterin converting factor subunit 1 [Sphingomonas sp.]MBX9795792.1 molybdopterin converting factor subunit 1 [Sphingomonas sp.]